MKIKASKGVRRAAIYLRMSSDPQKDSIEQQREACLLYASDHGYTVVGEYADPAISGISSKHKRTGFQQLIADAESGQFEYVICWEQNRASRSKPREFFAEMNPIADAGVNLVFTDRGEVDLDDFSQFLQTAVDANTNNQYVVGMSRGVVRGQSQKAHKGKWVSGTPPFGLDYIRTDPKTDPRAGDIILGDPIDCETVRLMYRWYDEGLSDRAIVGKLRDDRGLVRTQSFVQHVLTSPFYAGDYRWNDSTKARFSALRDGRITDEFRTGKNSADDVVFIADNHPAIVDRELHTRVTVKRAERKKKTTPFRNGGGHLLTGLCRCSKCGSGFSGSNLNGHLQLTCNGYRHGKCSGNYVKQADIVADVVASFDKFLSREHVEKLRRAYQKATRADRKGADPEAIKRELANRQKKYSSFRAKVREYPDLLDDFADDLRSDKAEIDRLEKRLTQLEASSTDTGSKFDTHLAQLGNIVEELKAAVHKISGTHPFLVRELLASMIESIELDVEDNGKGRSPRYRLRAGEITLKPGFNLIPLS